MKNILITVLMMSLYSNAFAARIQTISKMTAKEIQTLSVAYKEAMSVLGNSECFWVYKEKIVSKKIGQTHINLIKQVIHKNNADYSAPDNAINILDLTNSSWKNITTEFTNFAFNIENRMYFDSVRSADERYYVNKFKGHVFETLNEEDSRHFFIGSHGNKFGEMMFSAIYDQEHEEVVVFQSGYCE